MSLLVEACVDGIRSAQAAVTGGASRMELCVDRGSGGLTPSSGMIESIRSITALPLAILIRPRAGDFLYDSAEYALMRRDVMNCRELGAEAVVLGIAKADGTIDLSRTAELTALARPMDVVFHRAFDLTPNVHEALDQLIELGIDRVLTSGAASTAQEGIPVIGRLVDQAAGRITILAGGGIRPANAREIVERTGVTEIHLSGSSSVESSMHFRRDGVVLGETGYGWSETDAAKIAGVAEALK
jgi:copper homeostasis protein